MMVRVLVLLALCGVPAAALAQPDVLSEKLTKKYQDAYHRYDVARQINRAYPKISRRLVETENSLRASVMFNWYRENMEKRMRWVQRQDWLQEYKAMFVRTVKWRKETFDGGVDKLYRLSHKYQHVPNAEKYGYVELSGYLLGRATEAGHARARKEILDHPAYKIWPPILGMTRRSNYSDAVLGRNDGRILLALKYLDNPIFDDDRTKGYYWNLRLTKSRLTKRLLELLQKNLSWVSPDQRKQAESWIKSGHVPPM